MINGLVDVGSGWGGSVLVFSEDESLLKVGLLLFVEEEEEVEEEVVVTWAS